MVASSPKRPEKTAEEKALERRQQISLDKEIEETEEKMRLFSRRSLGKASLLSGAVKNAAQAAGARTGSASGGGRSLMSGSGAARTPSMPSGQRAR